MTCTCFERNTGRMLADSRATSGSRHPIGAKKKIHEIAAGKYKGALLGVSSEVPGMGEALKDWVTSGMDKEAFGKVEGSVGAILALPDRSVYFFDENLLPSGPLVGDFFAIGSGAAYALGAYKASGDAFRAIEVAIECDPFFGLFRNITTNVGHCRLLCRLRDTL